MVIYLHSSFEFYLGKACRKFRRGSLDVSVDELLAKTDIPASNSAISNFESGKMKTSKYLPIYAMYDPTKLQVLREYLNSAVNEYLSTYQY